eukprot:CAMPEP_0194484318 /NCGR_PEP_ID=MMETSP0253-20130528/5661_1 /TAXON_ID=2966 /ORGANISM="Noctiluca scintillans" /LENGTH=48 /DNA_ID= /DNA_START= /DNA_END= /DNA_ORIENTATION=
MAPNALNMRVTAPASGKGWEKHFEKCLAEHILKASASAKFPPQKLQRE